MSKSEYWTEFMQRRLSRRGLLKAGTVAGAGLVAGSALATGCTTQSPAPEVTTPSASQPKKGGILNLQRLTMIHLDPMLGSNGWNEGSYGLCVESLFRLNDEKEYGHFEIEPLLAESYEQPDNLTYIIRVRKGIKWQNVAPVNGRELTAEDAVWSIQRNTRPDPAYLNASLFEAMESVEVVDKYTLKIKTKYPSGPFMTIMALPDGSYVVPKELDKEMQTKQIGTGPFIMKEFQRDSGMTFVRNPDYWRPGRPYLDGINLTIITDPAAILAALRTGQIDIADLKPQQVEPLKSTSPGIVIVEYPGNMQAGIGFQHRRPPFKDMRMRQAVQAATDLQEYINILIDGKGKPNTSYWWYSDLALPQEYVPKQDLAKARRLIQEAGYGNGVTVVAPASTAPGAIEADIFQITKAQLAKVGIEVKIDPTEPARNIQRRTEYDYDMYSYYSGAHEVFERFHKLFVFGPSSRNYNGSSDPELDDYIVRIEQSVNPADRKKLALEYGKKFLEKVPYIFLFSPYSYTAQQPYVKGYRNSVSRYGRFQKVFDWWLDK